jgi:hypothetical protein
MTRPVKVAERILRRRSRLVLRLWLKGIREEETSGSLPGGCFFPGRAATDSESGKFDGSAKSILPRGAVFLQKVTCVPLVFGFIFCSIHQA